MKRMEMLLVEEVSVESKTCTKCGKYKELSAFHKDKRRTDGRASACSMCFQSTRRKLDRKEYHKQYFQDNKPTFAANRARRRAVELRARPLWADDIAMDFVYHCAKVLTEYSGKPWEVDHIVPLQGVSVCGLHVESNLQLLTRTQNRRKGCEL